MSRNDRPKCRSGAHLCIIAMGLFVCSALLAMIGPASVDDALAQTPDCGGMPMPPSDDGQSWACCNGTWYDANVYCCVCGDEIVDIADQ